MPCEFQFHISSDGNTVPYPPLRRKLGRGLRQNNHGFIDLRGKPEIATAIKETMKSPRLADWLIRLAQPDSSLFSLGCDIGSHIEEKTNVSGGYIQLIAVDYSESDIDDEYYKKLAAELKEKIDLIAAEENWRIVFEVKRVQVNLDGFNAETDCLWIWFFALADDSASADASRERLLKGLSK
jgi:hypothetical protein